MNFVLTPSLFFVLILLFSAANANEKHYCGGDGWAPFAETAKCIKLFPQVGGQFHKEARTVCSDKGGGARLVTVQSPDEQAALEQYLSAQKKAVSTEDLWLDGSDEQYEQYHLPPEQYNSSVFHWGRAEKSQKNLTPLTFTNWAPGQPVKPPPPLENNAATCIQLHADSGKWSNQPCSKANFVVCMRKQRWSPEKLQEVVEKLVEDRKNPVPLGFIYVQLPKEKAPQEIWSSSELELQWTDISSTFDSTFFRVAGSKAAPFGEVQEDFSPFIDQVNYENCEHTETYGQTKCSDDSFHYYWNAQLDRESPSSWSGRVLSAHAYYSSLEGQLAEDTSTTQWTGTLNFHSVGGEVRPRNMAVKVWKRTG